MFEERTASKINFFATEGTEKVGIEFLYLKNRKHNNRVTIDLNSMKA